MANATKDALDSTYYYPTGAAALENTLTLTVPAETPTHRRGWKVVLRLSSGSSGGLIAVKLSNSGLLAPSRLGNLSISPNAPAGNYEIEIPEPIAQKITTTAPISILLYNSPSGPLNVHRVEMQLRGNSATVPPAHNPASFYTASLTPNYAWNSFMGWTNEAYSTDQDSNTAATAPSARSLRVSPYSDLLSNPGLPVQVTFELSTAVNATAVLTVGEFTMTVATTPTRTSYLMELPATYRSSMVKTIDAALGGASEVRIFEITARIPGVQPNTNSISGNGGGSLGREGIITASASGPVADITAHEILMEHPSNPGVFAPIPTFGRTFLAVGTATRSYGGVKTSTFQVAVDFCEYGTFRLISRVWRGAVSDDSTPFVATVSTGGFSGGHYVTLTGEGAEGTTLIRDSATPVSFDSNAKTGAISVSIHNLQVSKDLGQWIIADSAPGVVVVSGNPNPTVPAAPGAIHSLSATLRFVDAGSYRVRANRDNHNYAGVALINATGAASPQPQTITFGALAAHTFGDSPFALTATASSGLPVSYASSNTAVATVSGSTVTIVGAGSTTITASQAGDASWQPAPNVQQLLTVNQASQAAPTVTSSQSGPRTGFSVTASGGGGHGSLEFRLAAGGTASGLNITTAGFLTATSSGTALVEARWTGDGTYAPSPWSAPESVTITTAGGPLPPVVAITSPTNGSVFTALTDVQLVASATDPDGFIAKVEFFDGGLLLGTVTTPSTPPDIFAFTTQFLSGTHSLTARAYDLAGASTLSAVVIIHGYPDLPYVTDFEAVEGYQIGPLGGQQGWTTPGGVAQVQSGSAASGVQSVSVLPVDPVASARQEFIADPETVVFVDVFAKLVAEADVSAAAVVESEQSRIALLRSGNEAQVMAFDGTLNLWLPTAVPVLLPLGADGRTQAWVRFTLREDFTTKKWDLYVDGVLKDYDIGFRTPLSDTFMTFGVAGHGTVATMFDDLFIAAANPVFTDLDLDGIDDAYEVANGLDPTRNDRDGDVNNNGLTNILEYLLANFVDTDGDGLSDLWELQYFGNLSQTAAGDFDGDSLSNLQEYQLGINPTSPDTDSDGLPDGWEVGYSLNPLANDANADPDGDGLSNLAEFQLGRNPNRGAVADTNGAVNLRVYQPAL